MDRMQVSTATLFNRYAEIFRTVRDCIAARRGANLRGAGLRILSFGCSTGAEMLTARAYFPDATILGCDIDDGALNEAAHNLADDGGRVFRSDAASIRALGPYDIILANSVLCIHPLPPDLTNLAAEFPFSRFEDAAGLLLENLDPSGLIVLYNTCYSLRDLAGGKELASQLSPMIEANGFVDKFAKDGSRLTLVRKGDGQRTYSHHILQDGLSDADFRECVFGRDPSMILPEPPSTGSLDDGTLLLGIDPRTTGDGKTITAGLFGTRVQSKDGAMLRRAWRKTAVDGSITQLASWDVPAGTEHSTNVGFVAPARRRRKYQWLPRWAQ